ncbi:MAG: IreB family regulatory phosphoprotein [bacterium]|nr:IreB family regulatory phosphoprotein [bacterium]
MEFNDTMKINIDFDVSRRVKDIVEQVYEALKTKGYDPISQIVGYILSGDPTYITSYGGARNLIVKIERDELLEELVKKYIDLLEENK